jgi:hypothetical protein
LGILDILTILLPLALLGMVFYLSLKYFQFLISANIFLLVLFVVIGGVSGYRPCFTNFFLILFPCGALFVILNFVAIFRFWGKRGYFALLPLFMSLLSFLSVNFVDDIGREVRIKVFKNNLNLYQQAVNELTPMIDEKGLYLDQVPQKYRHLAYRIHAKRDDGIVFIFVWDIGLFRNRSAFVYRSDGLLPEKGTDFRQEWQICERINEHWFRASNQ